MIRLSDRMPSGTAIVLAMLTFLVAASAAPVFVAAQETPNEKAPPAADAPTPPANGPMRVREVGGQIISEAVEIISPLPSDVLPFYLSKLDLNGVVNDNSVTFTSEIHVEVTRDDIWQDVPLRLPEARVLSHRYEGEGQYAMSTASDRAEGLTWKFRGSGKHKLFLTFEVPILRSITGQKFQLTLPKLSELFRGRLNIEIPIVPVDVSVAGADIRKSEEQDGKTLIESTVPGEDNPGAGSQVTFNWARRNSLATGRIALARNDARLQYEPEKQRLRLDVRQQLRGVDRRLASFRMAIPDGFEDLVVKGRRYEEHRIKVDDTGRRFATVSLNEEVSNEAELDWLFVKPVTQLPVRLSLEGLEVFDVDQTDTRLSVIGEDDHRVSIDWETAAGIRQITPIDLAAVAAVEVSESPYTIPVEIRQIRPSISVAPSSEITLTESEARLRSEFLIDVDRGRVDELTIDWDSINRGGWSDLRIEDLGADLFEAGGQTRIRLDRSYDSRFSVAFSGRRRLDNDLSTQLALPTLVAESSRPTRLKIRAIDSVEVLEVSGEGESRVLEDPSIAVLNDPLDDASSLVDKYAPVVGRYVVFGEPASVNISREIRQRVRRATSAIDLQAVKILGEPRLGVEIKQAIGLTVSYGRVSDVVLRVPDELIDGSFDPADLGLTVDDEPVPVDRLEMATPQLLRVSFVEPIRAVEIGLGSYRREFSVSEEPPTIPLFQIDGVGFDSLKLRVRRDGVFRATPQTLKIESGVDWVPSPVSPSQFATWNLIDPPSDIGRFEIDVDLGPESIDLFLAVQLAETRITRDGNSASIRAEYNLKRSQPSGIVSLGLPKQSKSVRFTWNAEDVADVQRVASPDDQWETYLLNTGSSETGTLVVQYRVELTALGVWTLDRFDLPLLPEGTWVEQQKIEYVTPASRHLIRASGRLAPSFSWVRKGLIWSRASDSGLSFPLSDQEARGNRYLFSTTVIPNSVAFTVVHGSFLVIAGGFVTFCVAFVLFRFPSLRQLPLFVGIGLLIAMFGLVDSTLLQVLLQPAALGLTLAITGEAIDRFRNGTRPSSPVLAVASESEFSVPPLSTMSNDIGSMSETKSQGLAQSAVES